jgi:NAD(P)-dependent dehydrogenase (short-subunit alcohol dehydrogenase family)
LPLAAAGDVDRMDTTKPFAVVTGASSGIGFELARQFATNNYNLLGRSARVLRRCQARWSPASPSRRPSRRTPGREGLGQVPT